ncbi:hypothetical protein ALC53_02613 [Atta colombica]|uniref:Uncharacterized protein n=1 Tax=Atta colombica TaxID=520822 RepID=A0A195BQH8_9HYME|nr:hypothetical protein ALC53_02613 [Atta colombica]
MRGARCDGAQWVRALRADSVHSPAVLSSAKGVESTEQGMNMKSCILHSNLHSLQAGFLGMLAANC